MIQPRMANPPFRPPTFAEFSRPTWTPVASTAAPPEPAHNESDGEDDEDEPPADQKKHGWDDEDEDEDADGADAAGDNRDSVRRKVHRRSSPIASGSGPYNPNRRSSSPSRAGNNREQSSGSPQTGFDLKRVTTTHDLVRHRVNILEALKATPSDQALGVQALELVTVARSRVKQATQSRQFLAGKPPAKHTFDLYLSTLTRYITFAGTTVPPYSPWPISPLRVALWLDSFENVAKKTLDNYIRCLEFAREETETRLWGRRTEKGLKECAIITGILENARETVPPSAKRRKRALMVEMAFEGSV